MTITIDQAIRTLRGRGYQVCSDPSPSLPFCQYVLQHRDGGRVIGGLTGATLRMYATAGVPSDR